MTRATAILASHTTFGDAWVCVVLRDGEPMFSQRFATRVEAEARVQRGLVERVWVDADR